MKLPFVVGFAIFLAMTPAAFAGESSGLLHRVSCPVVRYYVAKYSASAAEQWARSMGATEAEIDAARRCLDADATRVAKTRTRSIALGAYGG